MIRIRAGISFALTEAMGEGHCGLPVTELKDLAAKLLEVDRALIDAALELELADGAVISDAVNGVDCVFLGGLYHAEKKIAETTAIAADRNCRLF
jgi:exodeoxyribonuclease V alpha subunit